METPSEAANRKPAGDDMRACGQKSTNGKAEDLGRCQHRMLATAGYVTAVSGTMAMETN